MVEYTPEDMAAWRKANPDSAPFPDDIENKTIAFVWFILNRRFDDLWESIRDSWRR